MSSIIRRIACYVILAIFADRVIRLVYMLGFHRNVYTHYPGTCKELTVIVNGSEDIVKASNGLAFISSGVLRMTGNEDVTGRIFVFDMNQPDRSPREVRITGKDIDAEEIIPQGIDIWETGPTDDPMISLYVINKHKRQQGNYGIEVFDFSNEKDVPTLKHKRTIQHKTIFSPNDLVVVGENRFYVTNDAYLSSPLDGIEHALSLLLASVAYYDGKEARIVAQGLRFANGINVARDKKYLYVADSMGSSIHIFKIAENGDLEAVKVIPLHTSPDNIDIDDDGSLWLGCHPSLYTMMTSLGSESHGVSQVLNIRLDEDFNPTIREVFADTTGLIKASSIACRHGNAMLIGTIFHKAAYCTGVVY